MLLGVEGGQHLVQRRLSLGFRHVVGDRTCNAAQWGP
jgi:hypothetical protein